MKLLFDQNLSRKLVSLLSDLYPDSAQVEQVGLQTASDEDVWNYALKNGLMIASKDSDFYHRSMLLGHPPKVIWVRLGNCTTTQVHDLLRARHADVAEFERDASGSFLILP